MIENNKVTLKKANEAIAQGDHEGFLKYCTEDTKWTFVGEQILEGKEAVRQYMAMAYIHPPEFDIKHLIAENDMVSAVGYISMTDEKGKTTHYKYCDVWQFRNGLMDELTAFVIEPSASESQ